MLPPPRVIVLLVLLAGPALASSGPPREPIPAFKGVLRSTEGKLIPGGKVFSLAADGSAPAVTDENGGFEIAARRATDGFLVCPPPPWAPTTVRFDGLKRKGPSAVITVERGGEIHAQLASDGAGKLTGEFSATLRSTNPDTEVFLERCRSSRIPVSTEGGLSVSGLTAGAYTLEVHPTEYLPTLLPVRIAPNSMSVSTKVALDRGVVLDLAVSDDRGEPLSGVSLTSSWFSAYGRLSSSASSQSDGTIRIRLPTHSAIEVSIRAEGNAEFDEVTSAEGLPTKVILPRLGSLETDLVDSMTEQPVNDAKVMVRRSETDPPAAALHAPTSADLEASQGTARWSGALPGKYDISIEAPGYYRKLVRDLEIPPGDTVPEEVLLDSGGTLSGRVLAAGSQLPVEGATLWECAGTCDSAAHPLCTTDFDGRFKLQSLAPGAVRLRVSKSNFADAVIDLSSDPTSREDETEVLLHRGGILQVEVLDSRGSPASGNVVTLDDLLRRRSARTDEYGRASFTGVAPGTRVVSKYEPDAGTSTFENRSVTIEEDETAKVVFGAGVLLRGTVTREGEPIASATLAIYEQDPGSATKPQEVELRAARTDSKGEFRLGGLSPGNYWVNTSSDGDHLSWTQAFTIPQGVEEVFIDVHYPEMTVGGIVLDNETAEPLEGVQITVASESPPTAPGFSEFGRRLVNSEEGSVTATYRRAARSITGDDGRFELPLFEQGVTRASFAKDGYATETVELPRQEREDLVVKLESDSGGTANVVVRVRDRHGEPVSDGEVQVIVPFTGGRHGLIHAALGQGGTTAPFCIDPTKKYLVGITARGLAPLPYQSLAGPIPKGNSVQTFVIDEGGELEIFLSEEDSGGTAAAGSGSTPACLKLLSPGGTDVLSLIRPDQIAWDGMEGSPIIIRHAPAGAMIVQCGDTSREVVIPLDGQVSVDLSGPE